MKFRALRCAAVAVLVSSFLAPGGGLTSAMSASAASTVGIAALALANLGKGAGTCSTVNSSANSLGGSEFGTSCAGGGQFWCADFAKWVWQNADGGAIDVGGLDARAGSFYLYGVSHGTLHTSPSYRPQSGDAVVFDYTGSGSAEHVALVTSVNNDGSITTINGDWDGVWRGNAGTNPQQYYAQTSTVKTTTLGASEIAVGKPALDYKAISAYVSPATTATAAPKPIPDLYIHTPFTFGLYKHPNFPKRIGLVNSAWIDGIAWTAISSTGAKATGTLHADNCNPNCAQGTMLTYPVEIVASSPQQCSVKLHMNESNAVREYVFNTIDIVGLSGSSANPPASAFMGTKSLSPACGGGFT